MSETTVGAPSASASPAGVSPTTRPALLEVRGLRVLYGAVAAVDGLSLSVPAGQAVAVLGANGAGKSSTLRAVAGLQRSVAGEVFMDGEKLEQRRTETLVQRGLSLVTDTRDLFPRLSVAENLRMGALSLKARDFAPRRDEVLMLFPLLERRLGAAAWTLSGGEQQMLALGRALVARPRVLLLDEPSLGLAPLVVETIFAALAKIVAGGTSILLVEQTTVAALKLASYGYVLRTGRVALEGESAVLRGDPRVLDLYLGEGDAVQS